MKYHSVSYPDKLNLQYKEGKEFLLLTPFRCFYKEDENDTTYTLIVPEGFNNDLASIPQIFQNLIPVVGPQNWPSVVHDWCYVNKWRTRKDCDELFLAGLKSVKVGWIKRNAMYSAVRLGGWFLWRKRKDTEWTL